MGFIDGLIDSTRPVVLNCQITNINDIQKTNTAKGDNLPSIRYRENDKRYESRIYVNGKYHSLYSKNLRELKKETRNKLNELKGLIVEKNTKKCMLFRTYIDLWLENYKRPVVKEKTFNETKGLINNHINKMFGDIDITKLNHIEIQEKMNKLENSNTKNKIELYLNAILKRAVVDDYISKNPMEKYIKSKKVKVVKSAFTYNEQVLIWKEIQKSKYKDYFYIYLFTGIRRNEIYNIKQVQDNKIKVLKEKSNNEYKVIYVTDTIQKIIENIDVNKDTDPFYREIKKILNKLDIEGGLHTFRHTYATNQYYLGTPVKQIQEWLGHADLTTTMSVYTNTDLNLSKSKIIELYNNLYYYIDNK